MSNGHALSKADGESCGLGPQPPVLVAARVVRLIEETNRLNHPAPSSHIRGRSPALAYIFLLWESEGGLIDVCNGRTGTLLDIDASSNARDLSMRLQMRHRCANPVWICDTVGVGEKQNLSFGNLETRIARGIGARSFLGQHQCVRGKLERRGRRIVWIVVHHDHLEGLRRIALPFER